MTRISATQAARQFSDLLNRVHYQGTRLEIERGNEVIAQIIPVAPSGRLNIATLNQHWSRLPRLEPDDVVAFEETLQELRQSLPLPDSIWE
jgi:antitoxin (DNA-binding transcriptional repressor) of toxin-antitoxin stability system